MLHVYPKQAKQRCRQAAPSKPPPLQVRSLSPSERLRPLHPQSSPQYPNFLTKLNSATALLASQQDHRGLSYGPGRKRRPEPSLSLPASSATICRTAIAPSILARQRRTSTRPGAFSTVHQGQSSHGTIPAPLPRPLVKVRIWRCIVRNYNLINKKRVASWSINFPDACIGPP
ncbi:hypothetical protein EJ02DRAFT_132566 [Clathrospora elynae]|uniref:Uncharacterized protein n=1 Tax=Clathrospora elynae TaxID=706981 RepID=A0A6A5SXY0_9PLEO|nr:hypothetical protein EJ02DRAFT_132566 [Clathrospora elynae]